MRSCSKLQGNKDYIQTISGIMKQKKIRKGVIPDSVLDAVHAPEDFIDIDVRTDVRTKQEKLKRKKGIGKNKE